jgi:hypothetical protein
MNFLMSKVPEEGTGRRAALAGIRSAGKTGTTDAYRNGWERIFGQRPAGIFPDAESNPAVAEHECLKTRHTDGIHCDKCGKQLDLQPVGAYAEVPTDRHICQFHTDYHGVCMLCGSLPFASGRADY